MFLRKNQAEGRKTSALDEAMKGSDEDGGGDEDAAAAQQSSSAEQKECRGASAVLTSDLTTAGELTPGEGPDCSMNGGHEGEQMWVTHTSEGQKDQAWISNDTRAWYWYRCHVLVSDFKDIRYILAISQMQEPDTDATSWYIITDIRHILVSDTTDTRICICESWISYVLVSNINDIRYILHTIQILTTC